MFLTDDGYLNETTLFNLCYSYVNADEILTNINSKEYKNKFYENKAANKKIFIILMIIIAYLLITISPLLIFDQSVLIFPAIFTTGIILIHLFRSYFEKNYKFTLENGDTFKIPTKSKTRIFRIILDLIFGGIFWTILILPSLLQDISYLTAYIICLVCILGMFICLKFIPKRTKYGNEMFGKIKDFKKFIETAEKDKLAEKNEPQKTPSKPVDAEKTAALNNFLNSVPDNPVQDSERKYTTKDLDDFLDNFIKNHSSQS